MNAEEREARGGREGGWGSDCAFVISFAPLMRGNEGDLHG